MNPHKTNQKEIDILAWLKNETGDEYLDTRKEFKDAEIFIFVTQENYTNEKYSQTPFVFNDLL